MIHCRKCGAEVCRVDVESVYREAMALVRTTPCEPEDAVATALECVMELNRQLQTFEATAAEEQTCREDNIPVSTMGNQQPPQVTI